MEALEFAADFETNTTEEGCADNPVWAWGVAPVCLECEHAYVYGTSIETFVDYAAENGGRYWFHNAGFDSKFIVSYLLTTGYTFIEDCSICSGK